MKLLQDNDKVKDLRRGHDILLNGEAPEEIFEGKATRFSVRPIDFRGLSPIPKVVLNEGDEVKAGDQLFYDKKNPAFKFVSPVSGELVEIRRGDKRAITDVIILADKDQKFSAEYDGIKPPTNRGLSL